MIIAMESARKTAAGIWSYRLELGLFFFAGAYFWISTSLPLYVGVVIWGALIGTVAYDAKHEWGLFSYLCDRLAGAKIRRKLVHAAERCKFPGLSVRYVRPTLPGELVGVRVPYGQTVEQLEATSKALRAAMRVADIRVIPNRNEDRSMAEISIIRRDPFVEMKEMAWPLLDAETVNIREGIPAGLDEYGRVVNWRLLSRNIILGGAPDAGKSTALRIPIAAAVKDPMVKVWLMDAKPKAVEFNCWESVARIVRGRDLKAAVEMFAELEERVTKRYEEIVARGEVFVADDMELDVLVIDELPQFTRTFESDSKEQISWVKTIRGSIWTLIAMGRAAGMITILSAQKPTADIVPTESRDLIDEKFALHCNTRAMSDTILGAGAGEEAPVNAADIPSGQPGVGYYVGDNGVIKMRNFYISHKQALEVASSVASRQMDDELAAL